MECEGLVVDSKIGIPLFKSAPSGILNSSYKIY